MAYIGRVPQVGNYFTLDAITTSSTATYNLLKGGVAYVPETAYHLFVSLNGVIQAPITAYTVSGSTIVFASSLASTDVIDFITVLGDTLAIGTPSDGTVTDAKIVDVAATKLTGSIADARVPASAVTQHVTGYDDSAIRADIAALALREATNESSAAFNLPNSFIETFTDDTNLGTQTTGDRVDGYWATVYSQSVKKPFYRSSTDEWDFTTAASGNPTNATGHTIVAWLKTSNGSSWATGGGTGAALVDYATSDSNYGYFVGTKYNAGGTDTMVMHEAGVLGQQSSSTLTSTASVTDWVLLAWRADQNQWDASDGHNYINPAGSYGTVTALSCATSDQTTFDGIANGQDATLFGAPVTHARYGSTTNYATTHMNHDIAAIGMWNEPLTNTELIALANGGVLFDWSSNKGNYTSSANLIDYFKIYDSDGTTTMINSGTGTRNATKQTGSGSWQSNTDGLTTLTEAASATGTLIQSANTVGSAKTEVSGTMLYKDNAGTATLGTDLKIYFTCNGGTNWTEAASYNAITPVYSSGIKQVRLGKTTCTSGTDIRYKAVWANQASASKETQLHGIGINY